MRAKGGNVSGFGQTERRRGGATRKRAFGKCGRHVVSESNGAFARGRRGRPETLDRSNMTGATPSRAVHLAARARSRRNPLVTITPNYHLPFSSDAKDAFHWQPAALMHPASRQSHRRISENSATDLSHQLPAAPPRPAVDRCRQRFSPANVASDIPPPRSSWPGGAAWAGADLEAGGQKRPCGHLLSSNKSCSKNE